MCVHADLRAREKRADNRNRRNEHGKSVFTAKHGHGKSVSIKYGHKWVPGLKSSGKPILGRTISPRSVRPTGGDAASRFWKRGELEDARLREGRACTRSHFPRFELRVKSCGMRRAKKRPNFRTRSRSPPRASARGSCAPLPKRQRPRLHSATLATRNG